MLAKYKISRVPQHSCGRVFRSSGRYNMGLIDSKISITKQDNIQPFDLCGHYSAVPRLINSGY